MGTPLREEMISLSLFGGRLALAELILFSVFLTDILLLGMMGEINLSGVLLANAAFVLCYVTALGFLQGALPLAAQRFEAGDRGGYHAMVAMSLLLGGGIAVLVLLIFLVFPVALRLFDYRPDLIAESWRYISWVLPAYMLAMVYIPVRNGVIATGSSRWFLTLSLVTLVLNAGVSYVLGFGISFGGLTITGMDTSGIALAPTIVDSMLFAGFVWLLHRSGFRLSGIPVDALTARRWPVVRRQLAPAMAIGIPIGIVFFVDSTLFSSALMLAGRHDVQSRAAIGPIFEWSRWRSWCLSACWKSLSSGLRVPPETTDHSARPSPSSPGPRSWSAQPMWRSSPSSISDWASMYRSISSSMPRRIPISSHGWTIWPC